MIGSTMEFSAPGWELQCDVPVEVITPAGFSDDAPLPLVIANDGPEYKTRAGLVTHCMRLIEQRSVMPHRIGLVEPVMGKRNEWYSASPDYTRVFAESVVSAIREKFTTTECIGVGASLGAVAMLKCARDYPGLLRGLFMQSGAFYLRGIDDVRSNFENYDNVASFVEEVISEQTMESPVPIAMTCGDEDNMDGNVVMAGVLGRQGNDVVALYVPGRHNFEVWDKSIEPALGELLVRCLGQPRD